MKTDPDNVTATDGLEDILWDIVNVQNYQVHQFRNYLEANTGNAGIASPSTPPSLPAVAGGACTPSATTLCMTLDVFASETGYYNFATYTGSSPDIAVVDGVQRQLPLRRPGHWRD